MDNNIVYAKYTPLYAYVLHVTGDFNALLGWVAAGDEALSVGQLLSLPLLGASLHPLAVIDLHSGPSSPQPL